MYFSSSTNLIWPNDLTLDFTTETLYWVEANLDKIESSRLDGTARTTITKSLILHPFSITVFNGMLYWSDWAVDQILYTSLQEPNRVSTLFNQLATEPMGLKVVDHSRQPLGEYSHALKTLNYLFLCLYFFLKFIYVMLMLERNLVYSNVRGCIQRSNNPPILQNTSLASYYKPAFRLK